MQNNMSQKVHNYIMEHMRMKRRRRTVTAMACVVVLCTICALIFPASTIIGDTYCGKEEHTHTDSCYEENQVCTKEEHTHSLSCYSNPDADTETASVWEKTIPNDLGDNSAENVVAVAKSQLGYTESTANYTVLEDGVTMKGYTRYGAWYGIPYGDWCAMFASFCLNYAGVPNTDIPYESGCANWVGKLQDTNQYAAAAEYTPNPGDLIFFDKGTDGASDHVGIVSEVTAAEDGTVTVHTIEGNLRNTVTAQKYLATDSAILGYGILPENREEEESDEEEENDENDLRSEAELSAAYAAAAINTTGVNSLADLKNAFDNAASGDAVQLTGDITISDGDDLPLTLSSNKSITLDLNGHNITLDNNTTFFQVQSGSLSIRDSAQTSTGKSFTFDIMTSSVTDQSTGLTKEETQTRTITTNGCIKGGGAAIVTVSGGTFTLESGLLCEGTGRAVVQSGGTVNLAGGYINGFVMTSSDIGSNDGFGGAVRVSGGVLNLSGTVLCGNKAPNGGAIYNNGGTITVTGGVISGNTSTRSTTNWNNHSENSTYRCGGGGIYADKASTTSISGGYITCNSTTDTGYFDGGGGIFISGNGTTLNFSGGYITGNTAPGGAGIRTSFGSSTVVNVTGGFLSGNTATNAEGGGANFDRRCTATVTGGYITNNTLQKGEHWGGGGLFCADGATLYLKNALITENKGDGFGSGIGGCSTGNLYLYVTDGCAVYGNTASGKNYATGGAKEEGDLNRVKEHPAFLQNGYQDFFCALKSAVTGTMLGGNSANWQGTADGTVVSVEKDEFASADVLMGLTSYPTDAAISAAQNLAKVYINGNYSVTHGAGIMCNGDLVVGTPTDIITPASLAITGTKQLKKGEMVQSLEGKTFTFRIKDEEGSVVSTGSSDANGSITFDSALKFYSDGTYTYYITEVMPEKPDRSIEYDAAQYRLTVVVEKDDGKALYGETKLYNCLIGSIGLKVSTDGGQNWTVKDAAVSNSVLTLPDNSFINIEKESLDVSVKKVWQDENGNEITNPEVESVTVVLYQDDVEFKKETLSSANNWSYTWSGLKTGYEYRVEEEKVDGYTVTYETEDGKTVITNKKGSACVLPETGGPGTTLFTIGGTLLAAGSLLFGYVLRRRWKRS